MHSLGVDTDGCHSVRLPADWLRQSAPQSASQSALLGGLSLCHMDPDLKQNR